MVKEVMDSSLDSPRRLSEISADTILSRFVEISSKGFYLHVPMAERLLTRFSETGALTDEVLLSDILPPTGFRTLRLPDASNISVKGLRVLKWHPDLTELHIHGLLASNVKDLLVSLHTRTLQNLKILDVSRSAFSEPIGRVIPETIPLNRLESLTFLNVSGTEFNKGSLEMVVSKIHTLQCLDISSTKVWDISPLRSYGDRLKSLSMHGLRFNFESSEAVVDTLFHLEGLVHLDISEERDEHPFDIFPHMYRLQIKRLLEDPKALPNLVSFDISGKDDVTQYQLQIFVSNHRKLRFLGLLLTKFRKEDICFHDEHLAEDLVITGSANEEQVLESLRRYANRAQYVQKSLYHLFRITEGCTVPRTDIIELVLKSSSKYQKVFSIQMAATACLFNMCKNELSQNLHPRILSEIVRVDLDAMEAFPQHKQLQKNVLLTICNDRFLAEVNFDKYRCARLVMDCLCEWPDTAMNRMSVAICSVLAAKITTTQTSELGTQTNYMRKLLSIVSNRMTEENIDITLKFTLSALWNLTDESPETSKAFLFHGGMPLFIDVLKKFPGEPSVETKVLGLLNNIAEVHHLRNCLMSDSFITLLRKLLHASNIDVSYFAAGIVAHLVSSATIFWNAKITLEEMTDDLWRVVMDWKIPKYEMVAYRSFKPFLPLLEIGQKRSAQLWAVWAIHNVCIKNAPRYCAMLKQQNGDIIMLKLINETEKRTHSAVINLCIRVVETMSKQGLCPGSPLPLSSPQPSALDDSPSPVDDMEVSSSSLY